MSHFAASGIHVSRDRVDSRKSCDWCLRCHALWPGVADSAARTGNDVTLLVELIRPTCDGRQAISLRSSVTDRSQSSPVCWPRSRTTITQPVQSHLVAELQLTGHFDEELIYFSQQRWKWERVPPKCLYLCHDHSNAYCRPSVFTGSLSFLPGLYKLWPHFNFTTWFYACMVYRPLLVKREYDIGEFIIHVRRYVVNTRSCLQAK